MDVRGALALALLVGCTVTIEVDPPPLGGGGGTTASTGTSSSTSSPTSSTSPTPTTSTSTPGDATAPCGGDCDWTEEVVDDVGRVTLFSGFPDFDATLGPDGVAHVALYSARQDEIRYLSSVGWAAERLWNTQQTTMDASLDIEVASDGTVHVAAAAGTNRYARRAPNGTWVTDDLGTVALYSGAELALDANDDPHVFFGRDYLTWGGADWVAGPQARVAPFDVQIDGAGQLHALWSRTTTGGLQDAVLTGGAWVEDSATQLLANGGELAVGADGVSRVVFTLYDGSDSSNQYSDDLLFAVGNGDPWDLEEIETLGDADEASLVLDAWDRPHVSYDSSAQDAVIYAWHDGDGWVTDVVATGMAVSRTVLRLDPQTGDPVVFVLDDDSGRILIYRGS